MEFAPEVWGCQFPTAILKNLKHLELAKKQRRTNKQTSKKFVDDLFQHLFSNEILKMHCLRLTYPCLIVQWQIVFWHLAKVRQVWHKMKFTIRIVKPNSASTELMKQWKFYLNIHTSMVNKVHHFVKSHFPNW